jgi:hypothetical protein
MSPIGDKSITDIISNGSQARALTSIPPNDRVKVLNTATKAALLEGYARPKELQPQKKISSKD